MSAIVICLTIIAGFLAAELVIMLAGMIIESCIGWRAKKK